MNIVTGVFGSGTWTHVGSAAEGVHDAPDRLSGPFTVIDGGFFDTEEPDWQERALCAQTDPEAFFPEKGGSTREAKRICSGCDVRAECLDYALAHDERFGIWGGLSERERRRLRRGGLADAAIVAEAGMDGTDVMGADLRAVDVVGLDGPAEAAG